MLVFQFLSSKFKQTLKLQLGLTQLNCYLIKIKNESAESNRRRLHNFIIATPRDVTVTEAERVPPVSKDAPAHDAFTRLLQRFEPDVETLWKKAKKQIDLVGGKPVLCNLSFCNDIHVVAI